MAPSVISRRVCAASLLALAKLRTPEASKSSRSLVRADISELLVRTIDSDFQRNRNPRVRSNADWYQRVTQVPRDRLDNQPGLEMATLEVVLRPALHLGGDRVRPWDAGYRFIKRQAQDDPRAVWCCAESSGLIQECRCGRLRHGSTFVSGFAGSDRPSRR